MRIAKFVCATAVALCFGTVAAQADLITNGSFESPDIGGQGYVSFGAPQGVPYGGPTILGWTINPTTSVDIVTPTTQWGAAAFDGHQILDLVGFGNAGEIFQGFNTVVGQKYALTFAFGNNPGSTSEASADVTVTSGGQVLFHTAFHDTSTTSDIHWNVFTGVFTANSSTAILDFNNVIGGNNGGILLDAVGVAPVPEASTWAMMILGFAGIGLAAYRRRTRVAFAV